MFRLHFRGVLVKRIINHGGVHILSTTICSNYLHGGTACIMMVEPILTIILVNSLGVIIVLLH